MPASRTSKSENTQNAKTAPKPIARRSPIFDGRLNLEQQRKRAKELLRDIRAEKPDALARANQTGHKVTSSNTQLADAQLIIARENGFASWPKMKSHIDRMTERTRQITSGKPPILDTQNTLHLRCGSDIRHGLEIAGFVGEFLEFADPFCQGPVPDLPLDQFIEIRAKFISEDYLIAPKDALARSKREYGALTTLGDFDHVVLWFEHDSYDQLILARLLAHFSRLDERPDLQMICVGKVPGVQGFVGLGQLHPEVLLWLWENELKPVTEGQLALGAEVWNAVTDPDPTELARIARDGTPALPLMAPALRRHLRELPSARTGLGLTQALSLSILAGADGQKLTAGRIFQALMTRHEPLPFLGDLMFWHALKDLSASTEPVIAADPETADLPWPKRAYALTEAGRRVLAGELDYLSIAGAPRWIGGVEVRPHEPAWRWDEEGGAVRRA